MDYHIKVSLQEKGKEAAGHVFPIAVNSEAEAKKKLEAVRKLVDLFLVLG